MKIFSEIYNCYYQIISMIITQNPSLTLNELNFEVNKMGYEESILYLIPKLLSGEWNLFRRDGNVVVSNISSDFAVPLSNLQKSYIKAVLQDEKMCLFLDDNQIEELNDLLKNIEPLWNNDTFYYYDRFINKDNYRDETYIANFRTILHAINNKQFVKIMYSSDGESRLHHYYYPHRLEYSIKNDCFRLICVEYHSLKSEKKPNIVTLNLSRMKEVSISDHVMDVSSKFIDEQIKSTYYKEPVRIIIKNERNALERTMLQFANYEKNTRKIDEDTYECLIYYNQNVETELLIEILSFGPRIKVVGNERFLGMIKERLRRQKALQGEVIFV